MRFSSGALTQFFCSFQAAPHAEMEIVGSAGRIHLDLPYANKVGISSHVRIWRTGVSRPSGTFGDAVSGSEEETITYDNVNAYLDEVEAMTACVLDGAEPIVPIRESRANVAALQALCTSARESRSVRL
jgi:predicted dehydrogenase